MTATSKLGQSICNLIWFIFGATCIIMPIMTFCGEYQWLGYTKLSQKIVYAQNYNKYEYIGNCIKVDRPFKYEPCSYYNEASKLTYNIKCWYDTKDVCDYKYGNKSTYAFRIGTDYKRIGYDPIMYADVIPCTGTMEQVDYCYNNYITNFKPQIVWCDVDCKYSKEISPSAFEYFYLSVFILIGTLIVMHSMNIQIFICDYYKQPVASDPILTVDNLAIPSMQQPLIYSHSMTVDNMAVSTAPTIQQPLIYSHSMGV